MATDISAWPESQCRTKQKTLRSKITTTCKRIAAIVVKKQSKRDAERLMDELRIVMGDLQTVNDRIIEILDPGTAEYKKQEDEHLDYCGLLDTASGDIEAYEPPARSSDSGSQVSLVVETPEQIKAREDREAALCRLTVKRQQMQGLRQQARDLNEHITTLRAELKAAEEDVKQLGGRFDPDDDDDEIDPDDSVSAVGKKKPPTVVASDNVKPTTSSAPFLNMVISAPDDWIDDYVNGLEKPFDRRGTDRSSVQVTLKPYSGLVIDWFEWIGLWFALVHMTNKTSFEKFALLRQFLSGNLLDIVNGLPGGEESYKEALIRLKSQCGDRAVMRHAYLRLLDDTAAPREDPSSFKQFAEKVRTRLFNLTCIGESNHSDVIDRVTKRLPTRDRMDWNNGRGTGLDRRTMNEFAAWLCSRALSYQNPYMTAADQMRPSSTHNSNTAGKNSGHPPPSYGQFSSKKHARTHQTTTTSSKQPPPTKEVEAAPRDAPSKEKRPPYCFKCEGDHSLPECEHFKTMPVADRLTFALRRGLCYCCFGVRHGIEQCNFKRECGVNGCKLPHHRLLHTDKGLPAKGVKAHTARAVQCNVAFGVIRLDAVKEDGSLVPINVMIDNGSNSTLIREGLVRSLRIVGRKQPLRVNGVAHAVTTHQDSEQVEVAVMTAFGERVTLKGSTMRTITQPVPVIDWESLRTKWSHLQSLPTLRSYGGRIDVLVGLNHATLITAVQSEIGADTEPTATKTRLGWTIQGIIDHHHDSVQAKCHRVFATPDVTIECQLVEQLRRFCDTESFGTEHQGEGMSAADRQAVEKLEQETQKLEVGYQAPVLWRDGAPPSLLDNRSVAESRLRSLINKFAKNPTHEEYYRRAMGKNFLEGYARRLSAAELEARPTRYWLPHFGVPKVPGRPELRLVYDAVAKFRGTCLNDYVTPGPALQNPLPAVVLRFREGAVAWSADIGAMFSRIRLDDVDRRYHRFLWPEEDGTTTPCEMTRVTFGVSCSPYVSIRTTWRAADDAAVDQGEAAAAIRRNIYVDDYLDSAKTIEEAVRRATAVDGALKHGDFHLGHWVANDNRLLEQFSPPDPAKGSNNATTINLGADDAEMVLGITWRPATDMLGFRVKLENITYTRVGLLSKVAGLFDPQGTAAPMTVKAKIRLRQLGVKGLKWDDPVTGSDGDWWKLYFSTMDQLRQVEFSRCLFPDEDNIIKTELDTFVDASEEACAASCYIRNVYKDGHVVVRHVKSVTKLAPLKTVSVCKLELNAAVLGARLARFVEASLTRKIVARRFWTDSSTVRNWVRALSGEYQVYVSNRIGEIQTLTEPLEWRFVPGVLNPADAATRSQLEDVAIPTWWLDGPPFLYEDESSWPVDLPWMVEKTEMRGVQVHLSETVKESEAPFDWKSIRVTARNVPSLTRLEGDYLRLVRLCQAEAYPEELERLGRKRPIKPTSPLQPLTPFLSDDGVLRLGGRLSRAKLPYDVLHPPILPGKHPFARAIIRGFHEQIHHSGTDFTLAQVRQHFWITAGREAVKRVRNECVPCRRFRPKAALQMMGDVHKARLGAHQPPFTYTSVDYFGPIDVTYGRGTAKRWGALFTCLVTRAVYVDVAISASADDFLMVLRRFISTYRKPAEMFSDNGTNLTGAERLLREALERLKGDNSLHLELKALGIRWWFQPAQTPHFGGAHESLVRSVKNALYAALDTELNGLRNPSEEVLRTLLFEVAGLLNSRPLTYVSSDADDFRPLTPNDFLNRAPVADLPAGDFSTAQPREHYQYVQRMLTKFWELWHGSFLQSMVSRRKWTTPARNLAVGDFVLDDWKDAPRGRWRAGRIVKTYPGADGLVRAVDVDFGSSVLRRGSNQLALLEAYSPAPAAAAVTSSGENGAAIPTKQ